MKIPPTRSGAAVVRKLTDAEALALRPGDELLALRAQWRLGVLEVRGVRWAQAGEQDAPFDVPVVDARFARVDDGPFGRTLAWAPADLFTVSLEQEEAPDDSDP